MLKTAKPKSKKNFRTAVIIPDIVFIWNAFIILFIARFLVGSELYISSVSSSPYYYQLNSAPERVLFFKQSLYVLRIVIYFLLALFILCNYIVFRQTAKKAPEISGPVRTLFPAKAVNIFLVVLNSISSAATGILLTIKLDAYADSKTESFQMLDYLEQLNQIASQIWWLLILEFVITVMLFIFGKLSDRQTLQLLCLCLISFLPFIVCTLPFIN